MTNWLDTQNVSKFVVGSDKLFERLRTYHDECLQHVKLSNYPPYNIRKVDENRYLIEMAVAGFGKRDLEVELKGDKLEIRGVTSSEDEEGSSDLFRGIASRAFTRTFKLDESVVINNATLLNGMLRIWMEYVIPETKKPRKIEVQDEEEVVAPKRAKVSSKAELLRD